MSEFAFFGQFAGETARVCSGFPGLKPDDVASQVRGLHQRHGQAIFDVMTAAIASHSAELVDGTLPASSVLMMTVARGGTPVVSSPGKHADPTDMLIEDEPKAAPRDRRRDADKAAIQSPPATVRQERKRSRPWPHTLRPISI